MVDFYEYWEKFAYFHTDQFFTMNTRDVFAYPAPVAVLYELFLLNHWHTKICFAAFILLLPVAGAVLLWVLSVRLGFSKLTMLGFFGSALALSYPFWFELKQGNIEICICMLVIAGTACFLRGRDYTAAAIFGIAGSMKIFPLIYLGLLLSRRRYLAMSFGFVVAMLSSVVSLWLLCPDISIAWHGTQTGMALFQSKIALHVVRREIGFDHSLFAVVKLIWQKITATSPTHAFLTGYLAVVATCGTALYFLKIRFLPMVNQILCLGIASILLPPVSYDYTLIHLYLPWGLLVWIALCERREGRTPSGLLAAFLCMAILFAPETEAIHGGVSFGGQIKALTLMALWYIAMRYPFESAWSRVGPAGDRGRGVPQGSRPGSLPLREIY